ncbi:hypothetical protein DFP72DRAFT_805966 [Ephemerocybe angulata]|uniref:FAD-binding PCMH-type domain-containing protein n=1 Tax=Ephemerocybe angulata TaxID=980116 RepID=A0A8H6MCA9_9AGAR|nr:hypothetical protein DFP72DRAFT_805966 [Tulosesus angulatus]
MSVQPVITELKELCRVYKNKDGSKFYDISECPDHPIVGKGIDIGHYPVTSGFKDSSRHYLSSSSDLAAAAIQPGSDASLAEVLQIIAKYRVPFAVKGGGHSMTPDFSSTSGGIQISMTRFDDITYNPTNFRLEVGAGALWGAVYQETAKHGRCVVGGANRAVGVAGFTLGGGYSLKTNRLGLGIDHVQGFKIVTPGGTIVEVSDESTGDELELYQALRGGANNFGVVTSFTLNTHEQTSTYGAMLVIPGEKEPEVKQAILEHITTEKRKEAALECIFKYNLHPGQPSPQHTISAYCIFDAPKPQKLEDVPYKAFRDIAEPEDSEVDGEVESAGPDGAASEPAGLPQTPSKAPAPPPPFPIANLGETNMRGRFACIMVSGYTSALISAAAQEAKRASQLMSKHSGRQVAFDVWPFLPSLFDNSTPNAAWPHTPGHPYSPLIASFLWDDLKDDEFWLNEIRASLDTLMQVAVSEGVARADMPRYLNTSLEDVSVEMVYGGEENVRRLGRVRRKWDGGDVMSLAGGFRIPLAE